MARLTPLLLICHVTFLVSAVLRPPTNLKLVSENFQHILTWDDPNNESVLYYKVDCQRDSKPAIGSKSCSNITDRRCDLTKDFTDVMSEYTVLVRSFTDREVTNAVATKAFTPVSHTMLGPVLLDVHPCDHCIKVSIHPPISHLWSEVEQCNVTMDSDEVYPLLEYIIQYGHSGESPHTKQVFDIVNATVIPGLLPNTNYCVSVDMKASLNTAHSIPSEQKCVTTGPNESSLSHIGRVEVIAPVVSGVLLFLGLLLCLLALDRAGYIGMRKKVFPKVLKSLSHSESRYSLNPDCTSPAYIVPVEIISQKLEVKESQENEDKYNEGGYASRKKLLDSDTSAGDSSGPILSANSSSLESSGQMTGSSGEEPSSKEPPIGLDIISESAGSFTPIPASTLALSSDLPFNNGEVFNINMNSICLGSSVNTWTGLKNQGLLKKEAEGELDMDSGLGGLSQSEDIIVCTSNVLEDVKPPPTTMEYGSDNSEEDLSDNGDHSDLEDDVGAGYMRR